MRPLRTLIIYIAVVFIGGALLAPWLYWLAQFLARVLPETGGAVFPWIANNPFHRFVGRALLGLALIGLWPFLKSLGARSAADLGLVRLKGQWKKLGGGFLLGLLSLLPVAGLALVFHARRFREHISVKNILGAVIVAILVATVEEILFRGGLFGSLKKAFHWMVALLVSSAVYALVHFLEKAGDPVSVTWASGLEILPQMMRGLADWHAVVPGFFNLLLAGALLALAFHRTGNLYFSIGLHAGWIFCLKANGFITVGNLASNHLSNHWWWGTAKMVDGWMALPALLVVLFLFLRLPVMRKSPEPP